MKQISLKTMSAMSALAAMIAFTGCSNDDTVQPYGGEDENAKKNVVLKITESGMGETRTVGAALGEVAITLTSAEVIFYDANGLITGRAALGATDTPSSHQYLMTTAKATYVTIEDLPSSTTKVAVIGHTTPTNAAIGEAWVNGSNTTLQTVGFEAQLSEATINVYGSADLTLDTDNPEGTNDIYEADVTVAPTVARFEITDIKAGGIIESFHVTGVYMDDFYTTATVDGKTLSLLKEGSKYATDYKASEEGYTTAAVTYDEGDWTIEATKSTPTGTNVWGYYVFAAPYVDSFTHDDSGSTPPTIVLKIEDVILTSGHTTSQAIYNDKTFYVTIKGFTHDGATATAVESICSGYIYATESDQFTIDEADLKSEPHTEPIDVQVKVSPITWTKVPVRPVL
ncbi:MAG: hypothetical protein LBM62_10035 [Mediterranea sp.]|jgi:hypothetical protein|nr:hypothetical protein [Mediterranea sp.]